MDREAPRRPRFTWPQAVLWACAAAVLCIPCTLGWGFMQAMRPVADPRCLHTPPTVPLAPWHELDTGNGPVLLVGTVRSVGQPLLDGTVQVVVWMNDPSGAPLGATEAIAVPHGMADSRLAPHSVVGIVAFAPALRDDHRLVACSAVFSETVD